MRILVVGGGGREHAIAWALRRERPDAVIHCAPGNPGTAEVAENLAIAADDTDRIADAADMYGISLTIIGPEGPLAAGLADRLRAEGRAVVGPSAAAARIEASKTFAKEVMAAAGIRTAASRTFTDLTAALHYVERHAEPLVVKASGLAAGKGAIVCATRAEAADALRMMMSDRTLGDAGATVVIEAFLEGEEVSVLALTDGREVELLPASQDHKRLLDGDRGPNTGGMGAYAPVSVATPELLQRTRDEVLLPALAELRKRGAPFSGVLYAGLMVDAAGDPSVVEFNCRLGDPETQVVLPLLTGGLAESMERTAAGKPPSPLETAPNRFAVTTVLAAAGYPEKARTGDTIVIPASEPDVHVFHAGTALDATGRLVTAGGRVLAVTAVATRSRRPSAAARASPHESSSMESSTAATSAGGR